VTSRNSALCSCRITARSCRHGGNNVKFAVVGRTESKVSVKEKMQQQRIATSRTKLFTEQLANPTAPVERRSAEYVKREKEVEIAMEHFKKQKRR